MKNINRLNMVSGYKSFFFSYPALIIYSVIEFILFYFLFYRHPPMGVDTISYIEASTYLSQGVLHILRTPVYPFIILLIKSLFGNGWPYVLILIQFITFLISAFYLYKIGCRYISRPKYIFWIIAFYLLYPGIENYCFFILTEIFAVSFMIFFVWAMIQFFDRPNKIYNIVLPAIWLLLLIFLRPVFLCLIPVSFILIIIKKLNRSLSWRDVSVSGGCLCLIIISVFLYKNQITKNYGIKSISSVTIINNYYALRSSGIVDPELTTYPTLKRHLKSINPKPIYVYDKESVEEWNKIIEDTDISVIEEYENNAIKSHKAAFISGMVNRWSLEVNKWRPVADIRWYPGYILEGILLPNMAFYFLLNLLFCSAILFYWIRTKKFAEISTLLVFLTLSIFLTTVIGAQGEYSRLNLPGFPLFLLLFGKFCSFIKINRRLTLN